MAAHYTVKPGDYLPRIAEQNGFFDYRTIWDHARNQELKARRKNPNVLAPGDELFIPDKDLKEIARPTDKTHRFRVRRDKNLLRLVLEDLYGKPAANASCELRVEGAVFQVVAGADGKIEHEIPITAEKAQIVVKDGPTALKNVVLEIQIGHLDPVDQRSGQMARLSNLGYYLGSLDNDDEASFRSAVEEFQCDQRLSVDGVCGADTQGKLLSVHGC